MEPYIIKVPATSGKGARLSFIEGEALPFDVQRVFWIYGFEKEAARGGHAHMNSDQIIVCVKGEVQVNIENRYGQRYQFELDDPSKALFFPRQHWLFMQCSRDTVLLTFASCKYEEDIYQKDYALFKETE